MPPSQSRELNFLQLSGNHQEFAGKLRQLNIPETAILESAKDVAGKWFRLTELHLEDARKACNEASPRAAYSRAYYAAYNASKAVRFMHKGIVSLGGDDHKQASSLPDDFVDDPTDVARWAKLVSDLYIYRLHADYDNWDDTDADFKKPPAEMVAIASEFVSFAKLFLIRKHGVSL